MIAILVIALAAMVVSMAWDATLTVRALKRGAVESFTFLVGDHPKMGALILRDCLFGIPPAVLSTWGLFARNWTSFAIGIGPMIALTLRHVQGARAGARFLKKW